MSVKPLEGSVYELGVSEIYIPEYGGVGIWHGHLQSGVLVKREPEPQGHENIKARDPEGPKMLKCGRFEILPLEPLKPRAQCKALNPKSLSFRPTWEVEPPETTYVAASDTRTRVFFLQSHRSLGVQISKPL